MGAWMDNPHVFDTLLARMNGKTPRTMTTTAGTAGR